MLKKLHFNKKIFNSILEKLEYLKTVVNKKTIKTIKKTIQVNNLYGYLMNK